ncbi:MAG TPA: excinuclease ABC subunit UvrB [Candidatus Brocadiia bacterium]|nr:excinuclease ABC subunit UvrB [Candidatus Brocadiia bacterium]
MSGFQLASKYKPAGDQPEAIRQLVEAFRAGAKYQTLLGATGTGKTFTMAHVIVELDAPVLVLSHNKTLAAQLFGEFREFFPNNAVGYFVSFYDYYQPEAYLPGRDLYIAKETSINADIDLLRLAATSRLMERRDVIIVATVSSIYGLGAPEDYKEMYVHLTVGEQANRDELLGRLVDIRYVRSDAGLSRGTFRVRGDLVEVHPAYEEIAFRFEFFGDVVEAITVINPVDGRVIERTQQANVYPAKHFITREGRIESIIEGIGLELEERLEELRGRGKLGEAQRLEARTRYDIELLREVGFCPGIENYSRYLSGRAPGQRPFCLLDYFPEDYLTIVDESHVTVPQLGGMYHGDRSRKETLVEYGFRLPSALDNRPLRFAEWEEMTKRVVFVSATPADYELKKCNGVVVQQIIRPTGLVDPLVIVKPAKGQILDLVDQIKTRSEKSERVLVTTLTKRLAEDISEYLREEGIKCRYLHSEIKTLERVEILNALRRGDYDVIVGVNLLREGLDLPEVSLVAILDADREGFLRSETSLIQMIGRCARNVNAEVILYADAETDSMRRAVGETNRRRAIQLKYNEEHNITPETIRKEIRTALEDDIRRFKPDDPELGDSSIAETEGEYWVAATREELELKMQRAAAELNFELAAIIRDKLREMKLQPPTKQRGRR